MSYINQIVNVDAFYFATSFGQIKTFPRQVDFNNKKLTFNEGMQYLVQKGQHAVRFFDMSDGEQSYRLRCEDNIWTLVGTR